MTNGLILTGSIESDNQNNFLWHIDCFWLIEKPIHAVFKFASDTETCILSLGKGGKNRRRGKNENEKEKRELVFKEDGQGKLVGKILNCWSLDYVVFNHP